MFYFMGCFSLFLVLLSMSLLFFFSFKFMIFLVYLELVMFNVVFFWSFTGGFINKEFLMLYFFLVVCESCLGFILFVNNVKNYSSVFGNNFF